MRLRYVVKLIVAVFLTYSRASKTVVNLDKSSQKVCGKVYNITSEDETILVARGRLQQGTCSIAFRFDKHIKLECPKVCVRLNTTKLRTCDMKIFFYPVSFSHKQESQKIYDCRNSFPSTWCPEADVLHVVITEGNRYPPNRRLYGFDMDISPQCTKKNTTAKHAEREAKISYTYNEERSKRLWRNKVEGIITGVCLSLIFLVVLIVMWCHYRAQKSTAPPSDECTKKGPILSKIRSKAPFRSLKRRSSSIGIKPSESYQPIAGAEIPNSTSDTDLRIDHACADLQNEKTDSASTLVIGQDNKSVAENQV